MTTSIPVLLLGMCLFYGLGSLSPVKADLLGAIGKVVPLDVASSLKIPDIEGVCIINTLKDSATLLLKAGLLICLYDQGLDSLNKENANAVYSALKDTLEDTMCVAGTVLGKADALKSLGVTVAVVATPLVEQLRVLLDKAGLSKELMKTLCGLLKNALSPNCIPEILATDLATLIVDLKVSGCKGGKRALLTEDILPILSKTLKCALTSQETIPDLGQDAPPVSIVKRALADVVPDVGLPTNPGSSDILNGITCEAVKLLVDTLIPGAINPAA
ncbi:ranaspumin-like isoform X2 [Hyperolius riggenbachi]